MSYVEQCVNRYAHINISYSVVSDGHLLQKTEIHEGAIKIYKTSLECRHSDKNIVEKHTSATEPGKWLSCGRKCCENCFFIPIASIK